MTNRSRRRVLQATTTAVIGGLAGCSRLDRLTGRSADDDESQEDNDDDSDPNQGNGTSQQYTIPPVGEFTSSGVPEDGQVPLDIGFGPAYTPGDPNVYFEDELTFELFYYTKFPIGNSLDLTKVVETSRTPYEVAHVTLQVPFEDLPKNQAMRFRLRITNENTGDTEWAFDQRVFHYESYGDTVATIGPRPQVIEGEVDEVDQNRVVEKEGGPDGLTQNRAIDEGDQYRIHFSGGREFPAPELIEEIPYSWEAFQEENDLWNEQGGESPIGQPARGRRIELPKSHVDMANELMDRFSLTEQYDTFTWNSGIPRDYDYHGSDYYSVLDNSLYNEMAATINQAHELYGVNQHYAKLDQAMVHIQTNQYDQITGSLRNAPIKLPEVYWADPSENCVGHTFNLCWFLYHLGYTCGAVYLELGGRRADHMGVGMPVPESVMEEQFPEAYPEAFHVEGNTAQYIENTSDIVPPAAVPDTLGEHPWIYIETTGPANLGSIPFEEVEDARIRYAIEPEDNEFGTDIGVTNGE